MSNLLIVMHVVFSLVIPKCWWCSYSDYRSNYFVDNR